MEIFFEGGLNRDCNEVKEIYDLLVIRVNERFEFASHYLRAQFELLKETQLVVKPDYREYPKGKKEADAYFEKYLQFQVANYLSTGMDLDQAKQAVIQRYEKFVKKVTKVQQSEDFDLWTIYLDAFARGFDPHSDYYSVSDMEELAISANGVF